MIYPDDEHQLKTAEAYASAGFDIFPCMNRGTPKKPWVKWGREATSDINRVRSYWERWPDALIGLPTGMINQVTVLDIDRKNSVDGFASLERLGIRVDNLDCPKVRTPTGGLHLYFKYAPEVRNSAGRIAPGIDVRNDGGYVIVAGVIVGVGKYEVVL